MKVSYHCIFKYFKNLNYDIFPQLIACKILKVSYHCVGTQVYFTCILHILTDAD